MKIIKSITGHNNQIKETATPDQINALYTIKYSKGVTTKETNRYLIKTSKINRIK
jgi:hypothetical protein